MANDPKNQFYDDQDIFNIDIEELYKNLITSIDQNRSHFNALIDNSQDLNTADYQESRCHTFYRMTGFPVVSTTGGDTTFYSPGYNPNANIDPDIQSAQAKIVNQIKSNTDFITKQLNVRENNVQKYYKPIFSSGGLTSVAIAIGSTFIRSFENQFTDDLEPLEFDKNQEQTISDRNKEIGLFFNDLLSNINNGNIIELLKSKHYLKPFVVDPRIDLSIRPIKNRVCVPFLSDKSQAKIVDSPNGTSTFLKRPYIERVITTRLSNSTNSNNSGNSQTDTQPFIDEISKLIQSNTTVTDQNILDFANNQTDYFKSEILIFDRYFRLMRAVCDKLHQSIIDIEYVRNNINWQPTPNQKLGPEAGATLNETDPNDIARNSAYEIDIISATQKKYIEEAAFDLGLSTGKDLGDFAFSNIDDTVFNAFKSSTKSYDSLLAKLNGVRTNIGNQGIESLKNIEMIMGEFSGIGLLDVLAIQAALWIMPINSLLGMIDKEAFKRIKLRSDIKSDNVSQNDIMASLTAFEKVLKVIFKLIQKYIDNLDKGDNALNTQNH